MPLTYRDRGSSGTQLDIVSGDLVIGTVWKATLSVTAGQAVEWRWTFRITAGPIGFQHHGIADDLATAKAAIDTDLARVASGGKTRRTVSICTDFPRMLMHSAIHSSLAAR